MSTYKYHQPPPREDVSGPLPPGDYPFVVTDCQEPHKSDAGNWVLAVKLSIEPQGIPVFANPWTGTDRNGTERDGIAEFLLCVNRAPKVGEEPNWEKVIGARGTCRLKIEIAQKGALAGKEVNKVDWFHAPKQVGPLGDRTSLTREEYKQLGAQSPSDDDEPSNIPF